MKVDIGPYPDDWTERKVFVEIHDHDVWNLDYTLALIILPCLRKIKDEKSGGPLVENNDVPEHLKKDVDTAATVDDNWFARWDYVLDEMIWTFEKILDDKRQWNEYVSDRMDNGLRLFGKYYQKLWT